MAYHSQGPPPYGQPPQYGQAEAYPAAPNTNNSSKYGFDQGNPHVDSYGQPTVHISVPDAYGRYSNPAPGGDPSKNGADQPYPYGHPPPPPPLANVTVPNAFERHSDTGRPSSREIQPQHGTFSTNFSGHTPADETREGLTGYSFSSSFTDKAIRRAFIRKVYLILTAQLLVTLGFIAVFIYVEPVKRWVRRDGMWCYIVAYVTFLITYFVLICCPTVRRKSPGNFICLAVFTVAFSFLTGLISSFHDTRIVLLAAGITAAVCLAITIFAIQTKIDFTMCSGLIFALLMVLFFFSIACMLTYYFWGYNHIMDSVYAGLGALVFSLVLIYNTQMIVGGRKHELSPEEYIYGALQLYLDVVYIFLFLLSLMGKKN